MGRAFVEGIITLAQLQAYVVLRGSRLSAEDKKRVLVESGAEGGDELSITKVSKAVRMLGASFFEELTTGKKNNRLKVFDQNALLVDGEEADRGTDEIFVAEDSGREDEILEALWTEGDDDASLVCEYEEAAADLIQSDPEMASCYNAYLDARRRLADRFRSRGFWPPSSKGRGKGFKGKGKGGGKLQQRKSLQSRILSSNCRLCGQRGHWKAECPHKDGSMRSTPSTSGDSASISFSSAQGQGQLAGLPLEFVNLPLINETTVDEAPSHEEFVFVLESVGTRSALEVIRSQMKDRVGPQIPKSKGVYPFRPDSSRNDSLTKCDDSQVRSRSRASPIISNADGPDSHDAFFASHGSYGVADLGSSKTVIGSELIGSLIRNLHPRVRKKLYRCECNVQFRFGNQASLTSRESLVVPLTDKLHLKIAVVPGATPFLLSNALLRTLQAVIDTGRNVMTSKLFHRDIPLRLTDRGLYQIDLNDLCRHADNSPDTNTDILQIDQCPWKMPSKVSFDSSISTTCCTEGEQNLNPKLSAPCHVKHQDHAITGSLGRSTVVEIEMPKTSHISSGSALNTQVTQREQSCEAPTVTNGFGSSTSSSTSPGGAGPARPLPFDSGKSSTSCGGLRRQTHGQEVFPGVERGSGMGQVHVLQVQQESEGNTSYLPEVCRTEDRGAGTVWTASCSDGTSVVNKHSCRTEQEPGLSKVETAGQDKGQEQGSSCAIVDHEDKSRGDIRSQRELERGRDAQRVGGSGCSSSSEPDAQHGVRAAADHCSPDHPEGRSMSEPEPIVHAMQAGDIDVEAMRNSHRPVNNSLSHPKEKKLFWQLVHQIEQELCQVQTQVNQHRRSCDLFEIFCGPSSQLTHQAQQLGMTAHRFGKEQCDLQSLEGREFLFAQLVTFRPRHLWYSPECGPWCSWSQLNSSLSFEAFDRIHQRRRANLYQIALGLVLFRHQYREGNHFHWEQPQKSLMFLFKLPWLQQVLSYTWAAEFDMCEVGKLQDPQNHKMIKKGMEVLTTSERVFSLLRGRFCRRGHEHQPIEGTTMIHSKIISRSSFTESYPRAFARQVSKCMNQVFPKERPPLWEVLVGGSAHDRLTKRIRAQSRPKQPAGDRSATDPKPKRLKLLNKQPDPQIVIQEKWQDIFSRTDKLTPRVGRVDHKENEITHSIQSLLPDKKIIWAISCRGTNRLIAPPSQLLLQEAPFRRTVFIHRITGKIMIDEAWEEWGQLAQRQLIRSGHPARLSITVFACNPSSSEPTRNDSPGETVPGSTTPSAEEGCWSRAEKPSIPLEQSETAPVQTKLDMCDLQSQQHGPRFLQLSAEERALIPKAHRNLGHPSPERLSWLLKQQGYRSEVSQGVFDMKCSACEMHRQPKISRPSTIKDPLDFNDRISIDGLTYTAKDGHKYHIYHLIDYATMMSHVQHPIEAVPVRSNSWVNNGFRGLEHQWS